MKHILPTGRGVLFLLLIVSTSCSNYNTGADSKASRTRDYATEVKSATSVFKWDLKDYYFRSTPVGNFGVGTMYLKESKGSDPRSIENSWLLASPTTWFESKLTNKEKEELLALLIIPGEFGSFGTNNSRSLATSAGIELPVISDLLSVDMGVDVSKGLKISFTADSAINRRLVWPDFAAAVEDKKFRKPIIDAFNQNNYYIAAADIVFTGFKVNMEVDKSLNPKLHIKLIEAVGKVIGKGASGTLTINKVSEDKFTAVASKPVVAAVLFKEAPRLGGKGENSDPSEWKNAKISPDQLRKLENYLAN